MPQSAELEFYATCPFGLEAQVAQELRECAIKKVRPLTGGVAFFGSLHQAYRACLWLRCASRVLLVLSRFQAGTSAELYDAVRKIPWQEHLGSTSTVSVHARGTNAELRDTRFTALRVKDALCDAMVEAIGTRPDVARERPDVAIALFLRGDKATLYLDLSGEPLHRRGYRLPGVQVEAPLKENLAAGIVLMSGWQPQSHPAVFFDPLCGSGTLVLEAACIAADRAPGLTRDYWGFTGWLGHDGELWEQLLDEAEDRFEVGRGSMPLLLGSDKDENAVELARDAAKRAGLAGVVRFEVADAKTAYRLLPRQLQGGVLVSNPPYAHRLLREDELPQLYRDLDGLLSKLSPDWTLHLITSDDSIDDHLMRTPYARESLYNGKIETRLRHYRLSEAAGHRFVVQDLHGGSPVQLRVLEAASEQFALRLRKVAKERRKWAKREGLSCYRLYDADLPDYAVAIDRYEGTQNGRDQVYYCVAEYRAPKEIDEEKARRRYRDVLTVLPVVLGVEPEQVVEKLREKARGGEQYAAEGKAATELLVREGGYRFRLDLSSRLDTGLFLDHRPTRSFVAGLARGKRFLNLFAYTGTMTVYAAGAGATTTATVDLSKTYLSWAKENMRLNGFDGIAEVESRIADRIRNDGGDTSTETESDIRAETASKHRFIRAETESKHRFIRANVLEWLERARREGERYDLIFVDPPTFSNSKKMGERSWSVQRDHVELLRAVVALLDRGGQVLFSCNLRTFKPDYEALSQAGITVEDISAQTIPHDFARNPKIHKCYLVKVRQAL